ncbi:NTP transferase domain-containing protein [Candidatus Microgenomates bacterium]|nr:NTP transferase domain-containing protein [Candidatus Microgenomates bacterium]
MDCIILAGGKGTRMESPIPKVLTEVKGKAIIAHQIDYLKDKVDKIVLALGFQAEKVAQYIKEKYPESSIELSFEDEPLGTGGATKKALGLTSSKFVLVLNSDDITDIDPKDLEKYAESAICVAHPRLPFGLIEEKEGYARFVFNPILEDRLVHIGWHMLSREEYLEALPDKGSIESDVFPKMKLRLHLHQGFWGTLNSKKDISNFEQRTDLPASLEIK